MTPKEELKQIFADRGTMEVAIEISGFTSHRTTLIEELTDAEATRLLAIHCPPEIELEKDFNALQQDLVKREWKSKILALAERIGIKEKGGFHNFNNWMLSKSKFKKHLNAHSIEELKAIHQQLHGVRYHDAKSAEKPFTKAWWSKGNELKYQN
jgi:hypothetical protein